MLLARLVTLALLFVLSAYFSASETALFSLRPLQIERMRESRAAGAIRLLLRAPRSLLATVLVGNTLVNVLLSVLSASLFIGWFGPERGPLLATLIMTTLILLFSEIMPKMLAVSLPRGIAKLLAPSLVVVQKLLTPLTHMAVRLTDALSNSLEKRIPPRDEALTEEEIKALMTMGLEQGILGLREKEFIHNVFHLNDRLAKDIVTPRARVFAVQADAPLVDVLDAVALAGYSRVPVYTSSPENIVGYIQVSDLLWGGEGPDMRRVADIKRALQFYPETKRVGELLSEMHRAELEIAGVIDEHGVFDGLVSFEDAVEQVVGEIFDMHSLDRVRFTSDAEGEVLVTAQMKLDEFNRLLEVNLVDREAETIGGYMINRLGHIPQAGEAIEAKGLRLVVEKAAPHRVMTLRVRRSAR